MAKRSSEAELGAALRSMDFDPEPYVYRLPDPKTGAGVSNWKPCDFMVWFVSNLGFEKPARSAWVEAKDTAAVNAFPVADLRPSQLAGIRDAGRLGIPYLLAIYWRKARRWTISDAAKVYAWLAEPAQVGATSIPRELLMSRFGIDAAPADLAQTIRVILEEGF